MIPPDFLATLIPSGILKSRRRTHSTTFRAGRNASHREWGRSSWRGMPEIAYQSALTRVQIPTNSASSCPLKIFSFDSAWLDLGNIRRDPAAEIPCNLSEIGPQVQPAYTQSPLRGHEAVPFRRLFFVHDARGSGPKAKSRTREGFDEVHRLATGRFQKPCRLLPRFRAALRHESHRNRCRRPRQRQSRQRQGGEGVRRQTRWRQARAVRFARGASSRLAQAFGKSSRQRLALVAPARAAAGRGGCVSGAGDTHAACKADSGQTDAG